MAVEKHMGSVASRGFHVRDDDRAARGRLFRRFEADALKLGDEPVRRPLAIGKMRGNRRRSTELSATGTAGRGPDLALHRARKEHRRSWPFLSACHPNPFVGATLSGGQADLQDATKGGLAKGMDPLEDWPKSRERRAMAQHFDAKNAPFDRLTPDEIDFARGQSSISAISAQTRPSSRAERRPKVCSSS